jgi:CxxC-x17-CxxC domain-containing protein
MIFDKFKRSNDSGFAPRPKVQGNWKCADCGTTITELPFEPSAGKPVHCKDCWKKNRPQRNDGFAPRPKVQGNWKCSDCGTEITELPFEPSADRPIYCRDCWKKNAPAKSFR